MKTYTLDDIENYPAYHKEMWEWIAKHPEYKGIRGKVAWLHRFWNDKFPLSNCFACHYAFLIQPELDYCDSCPINLPKSVHCLEGRYGVWSITCNQNKKRELAEEIANLKWKWEEKEANHEKAD